MTYIRIPVLGILGFLFGCCITVIITLLFIPAREFWPSIYEDRLSYTRQLTLQDNFTFLPSLLRLNQTVQNKTYITESDYLKKKAAILCYSIEQEADDEAHARLILDTWAQHCDKTIMFYTSPRFYEKLKPKYKESSTIQIVYIDPSNSTIQSLFGVLEKHMKSYQWFAYVPPKVFLMPDNLRYYLVSSKLDPRTVVFAGRPDISRLTGTWAVSLKSPLLMSVGAVSEAMNKRDSNCLSENIQDPGCIIEITGGKMLDMRDVEGTRLITEMVYGNMFIKFTNVQVEYQVKTRFPVSIYIQGSYKNLIDLEYYLHHLKAFGLHPIQGSYAKLS